MIRTTLLRRSTLNELENEKDREHVKIYHQHPVAASLHEVQH